MSVMHNPAVMADSMKWNPTSRPTKPAPMTAPNTTVAHKNTYCGVMAVAISPKSVKTIPMAKRTTPTKAFATNLNHE